ncbi:urea ABC transporter permease subunit UrtB [Candidatus Magnetaquicoccus inordinatus]|uniref:urea ABC transporter permease subunit UrtB n=1 Tax=Candidatus Magnetaquicoccus inordinatus TaxID=2496818 RepID=UPI00102ACA5F|nr:urea ABC transporter permease subunit UrtB [Candidatus Magnetaquicoccus inordinatus]
MRYPIFRQALCLLLLCLALLLPISTLQAAWEEQQAEILLGSDSEARITLLRQWLANGEPFAEPLYKALAEDALLIGNRRPLRKQDGQLFDLLGNQPLPEQELAVTAVTINNRLRREVQSGLALLRLFDADRGVRLAAANALQSKATLIMLPVLERALQQEKDAQIAENLRLALALAMLGSSDSQLRRQAVLVLAESATPTTKTTLNRLLLPGAETDREVVRQAEIALEKVNRRLLFGEALASLFSGISLGSILLLTALGLAITYGVMGILNMAHGEMLMIGAYTTYAVQNLFRSHFPQLLDGYLFAAIPAAFLTAAVVGILLERSVIRWLYGRPLETLLATWGLSLILIQTVRLLFGAQNVEVANPSWMSGGVTLLPGVVLPWNRIVITFLALAVLALTWSLLNRTRLGLFVRAVTQNRSMAGCVGVPTSRIDSLAFALGSGIAGLGGVAISQVANVGPDMGQGYIVDSFLVVVLGGVGQLAGAVWAALGLGITGKVLEGWVGAVIAKIILLVFIIIFIQRRPQGLFVLKGRQSES